MKNNRAGCFQEKQPVFFLSDTYRIIAINTRVIVIFCISGI